MVEYLFCNEVVMGSIPIIGSNISLYAPIAQSAEAWSLSLHKCGFESLLEYQILNGLWKFDISNSISTYANLSSSCIG